MKKLIAIAVLACMTLTFAGCGQDNNAKEESKGTVSIAESSVEESAGESSEENSKSEESSAEESSKEEASENSEASEKESSAEESSEKAESDNEQAEKEAAEKAAAEKAAAEKAAAEKAAAEKAAAEKAAAEKAAAEKAAAEKAAAEKAAAEKAAAEKAAAEKAAAEKEAAEKAAAEKEAAEKAAAEKEASEKAAAEQQSANGSFSNADLAMSFNGKTVTLLTGISDAISAVGNASSTEKLPSCLSLDSPDDVVYTYNGFKLQTLTDSSGEKVYNIDITGGSATTSKGIAVGNSAADIEKAYGQPAEADDFLIRYTVDGGKNTLDFMMENSKVTEIIIAYAP